MAAAAAARRPEVPSWRRPLAVSPTTPTSGAAQMKRGKRPSAPTRPICPSRRISALKAHALLQWLHQCSPAQPSDAPLSLSLSSPPWGGQPPPTSPVAATGVAGRDKIRLQATTDFRVKNELHGALLYLTVGLPLLKLGSDQHV
uniref:Uncharacterized protein n=1 Tax=Oryza glumipatula TaxID=40148 RepID=A0A0D9ZKP2_9ORYZ